MKEKTVLKASAVVSGISGIIILFSTFYPIASYESMARQKYPTLLSPITEQKDNVSLEDVDYTKASNWFADGAKRSDFVGQNSNVTHYTLTIPKLNIKNATVALGGEDLSENLIQYPGTAPPGKTGNSVVFGHSILPLFYNPEDYMAIFSTLSTLEKGDEIKINYDGVLYTYKVESMFEVLPTELEVLEQNKSDSFISLITCSPPGHPDKPKRLVVRARIVDPGGSSPQQANATIRN